MSAVIIKMSIQRMVCTGCGAETNANCNCGVSYVPKAHRAKEAIKTNPEKSDRSIAKELGISQPTVSAARHELGDKYLSPERHGLDDKTYSVRSKKEDTESPSEEITPKEKKQAFMIFAFEARQLANYDGPVDEEVVSQAAEAAEAWRLLTQTLKEQYRGFRLEERR